MGKVIVNDELTVFTEFQVGDVVEMIDNSNDWGIVNGLDFGGFHVHVAWVKGVKRGEIWSANKLKLRGKPLNQSLVLEAIAKYTLPSPNLQLVEQRIATILPNDIISTGMFAHKTQLDRTLAETILIDLANIGFLQLKILVECSGEEPHIQLFDSVDQFLHACKLPAEHRCSDCGAELNFKNVKAGFQKRRED